MKQLARSLLLFSVLNTSLHADESTEISDFNLEFLEFLGSFETENGQWLDPVEINDMLKIPEQLKTKESNDE